MMRALSLILAATALLALPLPVAADHDDSDAYQNLFGVVYIDDDDLPYIYLEANGTPGLQRDDDGNADGHPAHDDPDLWVF